MYNATMPLPGNDLDRLSDDVYLNRRITASTYCAHCGYNLRTLPYVYHCPECGQEYNARPLHMKGIFVPADHEPPVGRIIVAGFWYVIAAALIAYAVKPLDPVPLAIGVLFLLFGLVQSVLILRQWQRFQIARYVARRIKEESG